MNVREMLEMAHLDALGFLEGAEQARFEEAFRAAPEAVRAQVRAEQSRWAGAEGMLPLVEPPPGLRDRVLDSVSEAILASEAVEQHAALAGGTRVSKWWRAGSIGLMSACVVFGIAFAGVARENTRLLKAVEDERVLSSTAEFRGNAPFDASGDLFFSKDTVHSIFTAGAGASEGRAAIYTNPAWPGARLFVDGLPRTNDATEYRVVVVDGTQVRAELGRFAFDGQRRSVQVASAAKGTSLAIVAVARGASVVGNTLASSQVLLVATIG